MPFATPDPSGLLMVALLLVAGLSGATARGVVILSIMAMLSLAWDGSGYPHGLKGEQIPLAARIFAVVDVWDAIRSDRPYRSGWSEERALDFIRSVSGTHLDPDAVDLFMHVHAEDTSRQAEESLAPRA